MTKTVNSIKSKNGNTPLATSPSLAFATDCITYKFRPTGGVIKAHSTKTTENHRPPIGSGAPATKTYPTTKTHPSYEGRVLPPFA